MRRRIKDKTLSGKARKLDLPDFVGALSLVKLKLSRLDRLTYRSKLTS
jgi:hypothetical protein